MALVDRCSEIKFSGVISSSRVWRKGAEKKAWNVDLKLVLNWVNYLFAEHTSNSLTSCNSFLN